MKNNIYPCKPQFCYIKMGFKRVKVIYACFRDTKVMTLIPNGGCPNSRNKTGISVVT